MSFTRFTVVSGKLEYTLMVPQDREELQETVESSIWTELEMLRGHRFTDRNRSLNKVLRPLLQKLEDEARKRTAHDAAATPPTATSAGTTTITRCTGRSVPANKGSSALPDEASLPARRVGNLPSARNGQHGGAQQRPFVPHAAPHPPPERCPWT